MFSLVTTCKNRESHLRQSLPGWLALPGLAEVVIVDWSTGESIADLVDLDPRVRVLRVEDEPKWMQPYPTNFGISRASHELILKCDADCIPSPAVAALVPSADRFFAGHWRSGRPLGKACVNGQCFFTRSMWEKINGYSEVFRVYARDDEDFYERLAAAGCARHEIPATQLDFIEHTQEARVAHQVRSTHSLGAQDLDAFLHQQSSYHEMTNLVISQLLPWGPWFNRAAYAPLSANGRFERFTRDKSREIPLTAPVLQQAHAHALKAVVTQLFSLPAASAARLDLPQCVALLKQHLAKRAASSAAVSQLSALNSQLAASLAAR